jgi:hypothetical protein
MRFNRIPTVAATLVPGLRAATQGVDSRCPRVSRKPGEIMQNRATVLGAISAALMSLLAGTAFAGQGGLTGSAAINEDTLLGATFSITAIIGPNSNNTSYCGGDGLAVVAEGHGVGYSARLGPVEFFLQKTVDAPPGGNMHGCVTLKNPEGDTLNLTYDGTWGDINANNFADASGNLTVNSATGHFQGLKRLDVAIPFTASFLLTPTTVTAYYMVQ